MEIASYATFRQKLQIFSIIPMVRVKSAANIDPETTITRDSIRAIVRRQTDPSEDRYGEELPGLSNLIKAERPLKQVNLIKRTMPWGLIKNKISPIKA